VGAGYLVKLDKSDFSGIFVDQISDFDQIFMCQELNRFVNFFGELIWGGMMPSEVLYEARFPVFDRGDPFSAVFLEA